MPTLQLPPEMETALRPLLALRPLEEALGALVVAQGGPDPAAKAVEEVLRSAAWRDRPALAAGLWLYVDQLDRSHKLSQGDERDPTLSFWHGIMHRREGDFANSHYWFRRVGEHPAMKRIESYDPHRFIDLVEAAHRRGQTPAELTDLQRREWIELMHWCAER